MLYCREFPTRTNLVFSVAQSSSSRFVSIGSRRTRRSTRRGFAARVSFCVGLLDSPRLLATVKRKLFHHPEHVLGITSERRALHLLGHVFVPIKCVVAERCSTTEEHTSELQSLMRIPY